MNFMVRLSQWFTDPANWTGPNGIPVRVAQHVELSVIGICLAIAIALPVGLLIGHTRKREWKNIGWWILRRVLLRFSYYRQVFINRKGSFGERIPCSRR